MLSSCPQTHDGYNLHQEWPADLYAYYRHLAFLLQCLLLNFHISMPISQPIPIIMPIT